VLPGDLPGQAFHLAHCLHAVALPIACVSQTPDGVARFTLG
jgi:hypothetical protein